MFLRLQFRSGSSRIVLFHESETVFSLRHAATLSEVCFSGKPNISSSNWSRRSHRWNGWHSWNRSREHLRMGANNILNYRIAIYPKIERLQNILIDLSRTTPNPQPRNTKPSHKKPPKQPKSHIGPRTQSAIRNPKTPRHSSLSQPNHLFGPRASMNRTT